MTSSIDTIEPAAAPPLWQNLFGIIDKPVVTFEAVLARQRWLRWGVPLLVLLLAFAVLMVVQAPYLLDNARQQAQAQLAAMPAEQADAARATMSVTLSLPFMLATGLGFGAIALLLAVTLQSAYFYLAALLVGGNDTSFGDMFTISSWSRLPLAVGYLVQAAFVAVSQGTIQYPGLAALAASGDPLQDAQNPLIPLLAGLDLFWLWHLLLVVVGVAVAAHISRGKSLLLVLIYGSAALGITVIPTLFFSGGLGG